jgi:hypothetical protein
MKKNKAKSDAIPISSLTLDAQNANRGTERGRAMLASSLKEYGAGRSILIDKHGNVIAGNKTLEQAFAAGHKDVLVVKTDGKKLVAVQRMDLDLKDPKAKALAVADNRSSEVGLSWDSDVLQELEVDLTDFWDEKELQDLLSIEIELPTESETLPSGYGIMIEKITEAQQLELLERLSKEGFTCRALTF